MTRPPCTKTRSISPPSESSPSMMTQPLRCACVSPSRFQTGHCLALSACAKNPPSQTTRVACFAVNMVLVGAKNGLLGRRAEGHKNSRGQATRWNPKTCSTWPHATPPGESSAHSVSSYLLQEGGSSIYSVPRQREPRCMEAPSLGARLQPMLSGSRLLPLQHRVARDESERRRRPKSDSPPFILPQRTEVVTASGTCGEPHFHMNHPHLSSITECRNWRSDMDIAVPLIGAAILHGPTS